MRNLQLSFLLASSLCVLSVNAHAATNSSNSDKEPTELNEVVVEGKLNKARESIVSSLGATEYNIGQNQIAHQSQGANASFGQVVLRAPGAAEDSSTNGTLHIRGEHANVQYRINDVLLPEGISGFGQELDARFADNVSLITGSLPAQYGYRTAGVVDVHTRSGVFQKGGDVSMYGGSHNTIRPSFSYGDTAKGTSYYFNGSHLEDDLGIENPTRSREAIHDHTQQYKGFGYLSKVVDDTSRVSLMLSGSHSHFQIPNNPGQATSFTLTGVSDFDSKNLNEKQGEGNYYGIVSYQKSINDLNLQLSGFTRDSEVLFVPDQIGDLMINGAATRVKRSLFSNGLELDSSYVLTGDHTLRGGGLFTLGEAFTDNTSRVFPTNPDGTQASSDPQTIIDNHHKGGTLFGVYLQDEWKVSEPLTINFGGRFDQANQYVDEHQFSPRVNAVYKIDKETTAHVGYARYFTPAPLEQIQSLDPHIYDNTTNASAVTQNSNVHAERAHYFDAGLTHSFLPELQVGVDTYYKTSRNQLDDGVFGQAQITTPFNYKYGKVYGTEVTATYKKGGFSSYGNVAWSQAMGKAINSSQFLFSQDDLNGISNKWIRLDHDQRVSISGGSSYTFAGTTVYADLLYGSGLRRGSLNSQHVKEHYPVNMGVEHAFKIRNLGDLKARFDVVNLFDKIYALRDGSGIGTGAPKFGQRRGFYGGVSLEY